MNCESIQEHMIDTLYGEEVAPRRAREFFQHLSECPGCDREYLELLQTRERLAEWRVDQQLEGKKPDRSVFAPFRILGRIGWMASLQRIAAGVLILVGVISIVQSMGYLGGKRLLVSEQQLTQTMQELITAHQIQERELMLQALLTVKEDIELTQEDRMEQLQQYLLAVEERYLNNLEESNHYLSALLSR